MHALMNNYWHKMIATPPLQNKTHGHDYSKLQSCQCGTNQSTHFLVDTAVFGWLEMKSEGTSDKKQIYTPTSYNNHPKLL